MAKRSLLIILGAFLVSVAVRVPQLDRPLSAHHEYCTAFTLIALTNWYEDGFATHHGVPSGKRSRFSRLINSPGMNAPSGPTISHTLHWPMIFPICSFPFSAQHQT